MDNDGDGVPDSVWVDLGMPVRSTTDGRLYKPLFAILCVDLDGRMNLNAHGSLAQADPAATARWSHSGVGPVARRRFAGGGTAAPAARIGFWPGGDQSSAPCSRHTTHIYQQLLTGNAAATRAATGATAVPGSAARSGPIMANKWFEYGQNSGSYRLLGLLGNVNNAGSYGSPPDPFGVGAVGLDQAGRPVYAGMKHTGGNYSASAAASSATPYELNLGPNVARGLPSGTSADPNNPFSLSELERMLRPYDRDATGLPAPA